MNVVKAEGSRILLLGNSIYIVPLVCEHTRLYSYMFVSHACCCCRFIWRVFNVFAYYVYVTPRCICVFYLLFLLSSPTLNNHTLLHTNIIGHDSLSVRFVDIVSHTNYVVCVNYL